MYLTYLITSPQTPESLETLRLQLKRTTALSADKWEIEPMGDDLNATIARCLGKYIVILEDSLLPETPASLKIPLRRMENDPTLAAITGAIKTASGTFQIPPLPTIGWTPATCFRKSAIETVGGFNRKLTGISRDYDITFRLWAAGHRIEPCEQMVLRRDAKIEPDHHEAISGRILRDNLLIANRYLPGNLREIFWEDWKTRYGALATRAGHKRSVKLAIQSARIGALLDRFRSHPHLDSRAIENIFGFHKQSIAIGNWAHQRAVWRVVLAEFGDNLFAVYNACRASGMQIRCIADSSPAFQEAEYRGVPIVPASRAFEGGGIDGVIISSLHPADAAMKKQSLRRSFKGPILTLAESTTGEMRRTAVAA